MCKICEDGFNMLKRNFILSTDWWTDCDDAVAIRMIARAHRDGRINLKAISIDACMDCSVASLDGFLTCEGVTDVPIGIDFDATDFGGVPKYQYPLVKYAERYSRNEDAQDAVSLIRSVLSSSEDKTEIIAIGFPNVVAGLLESEGDKYSELCGTELVRQKVSKLWVMAGKWDEDGGLEHNFCNNKRASISGDILCRKCPVPITFLGWEVGDSVISGAFLEENDVLHSLMRDHGSENGRSSWDPMTVLMALIGDEEEAGYRIVRGIASINPESGANHFEPCHEGLHAYVVKERDDKFYEDSINSLIG